jgi:hypothetical protein
MKGQVALHYRMKQGAVRLVGRKGHSAFSFLFSEEAVSSSQFSLKVFIQKIMIHQVLTIQTQI